MSSQFSQRYHVWNSAIAEHCLLAPTKGSGGVSLTVTPRILAAAINAFEDAALGADEARDDFIESVRGAYALALLRVPPLSEFRGTTGGVPDSVGLLAASVLAAYEMHSNDDATARAYYPRLAQILGCELAGTTPEGFTAEIFEELWVRLARWLASSYQLDLVQAPDVFRRYVALPMAHVPLRRVDIERLPEFFVTKGYDPGTKADHARLEYDLVGGQGSWRGFTAAGRAALDDRARRPSVVAQVANELLAWDGSYVDGSDRRHASMDVAVDFVARRPVLTLHARKPAGFPDIFDGGAYVFESSEDGWYEPLGLSAEHGHQLSNGFLLSATHNGRRYVLQRAGARVIPLQPIDDVAGYVSDSRLRLGTAGALLVVTELASIAARYLAELTGAAVRPMVGMGIPSGWTLFWRFVPRHRLDVPTELSQLSVSDDPDVLIRGGLKLGRRSVWLHEAPPEVVLSNVSGSEVTVDGIRVMPGQDGTLPTRALFRQPGVHILRVARLRRRLTTVEPQIHPDCSTWCHRDDRRFLIALPRGTWAVLGRVAGTLETHALTLVASRLCAAAFEPVWAVCISNHYRRVVYLGPSEVANASPVAQRCQGAKRWADAVYLAKVRNASIEASENVDAAAVHHLWSAYYQLARRVKKGSR